MAAGLCGGLGTGLTVRADTFSGILMVCLPMVVYEAFRQRSR